MIMTSLAALLHTSRKSIFTLDTLVDLSRNTCFITMGALRAWFWKFSWSGWQFTFQTEMHLLLSWPRTLSPSRPCSKSFSAFTHMGISGENRWSWHHGIRRFESSILGWRRQQFTSWTDQCYCGNRGRDLRRGPVARTSVIHDPPHFAIYGRKQWPCHHYHLSAPQQSSMVLMEPSRRGGVRYRPLSYRTIILYTTAAVETFISINSMFISRNSSTSITVNWLWWRWWLFYYGDLLLRRYKMLYIIKCYYNIIML